VAALPAALGQVLDDLVDLLDRQQPATGPRMAGLAARLAVGALALASPLARTGVRRGRKRGVIAVAPQLAKLLLEPPDPTLEAIHLVCQRCLFHPVAY
jgi:hypothetical protein